MSYNLSIVFSSSDLEQVYANGQSVVLVKGVDCTMQEMPIAWVALRQPLTNNQVSWNNNYQAFASSTQLMNGVVINPTSQASVGFGQCIPYASQGFGMPETGAAPATAMSIINQANGQQITTGLSQSCTANGMTLNASPICGLSLMYQMMTTLTPRDSLNIFMANYMNSGTVMSRLPSNACAISFSGGTSSLSVRYDGASGSFVTQ